MREAFRSKMFVPVSKKNPKSSEIFMHMDVKDSFIIAEFTHPVHFSPCAESTQFQVFDFVLIVMILF